MLNIFNRTIVYTTYTKDNLDKVCEALAHHGLEYLIRTTRTKSEFEELGSAYQLYVHRDDADETQALIHRALFPEEAND